MQDETFKLVIGLMKIVEKHHNQENLANLLEIIEFYKEDFDDAQTATVLKEVADFVTSGELMRV